MKGKQNLKNKKVTSNNMTDKPLPFPYRSKSNSREHRNPHFELQNHTMETVTLNHQVERDHHTQDYKFFRKSQTLIIKTLTLVVLDHNHITIIEIEIVHTEQNGNAKCFRGTTFRTTAYDLLLELNRDTQDEYINCQEECNTLTEEYFLSTKCKCNILVLPPKTFRQKRPDETKTIFSHLEIDF